MASLQKQHTRAFMSYPSYDSPPPSRKEETPYNAKESSTAAARGILLSGLLGAFGLICIAFKFMTSVEVAAATVDKEEKILNVTPAVQNAPGVRLMQYTFDAYSDEIYTAIALIMFIRLAWQITQLNTSCDFRRMECGPNNVHRMNEIVFVSRMAVTYTALYLLFDFIDYLIRMPYPNYTISPPVTGNQWFSKYEYKLRPSGGTALETLENVPKLATTTS